MNTFILRVVSVDREFYNGDCLQMQITTPTGLYGIMAHHESCVVGVSVGEMRYQTPDGVWHPTVTGSGYVRIAENKVTVIVDTCERPDEIDERRAAEAKERAEESLRRSQSEIEYRQSQASLARALARLKIKNNNFDK